MSKECKNKITQHLHVFDKLRVRMVEKAIKFFSINKRKRYFKCHLLLISMEFDRKSLVEGLYKVKAFALKAPSTIIETLREGKVQKWVSCGICVYGLPALYRYVTGSPELPYLPNIQPPSEYIPPNLSEKLLVNSVAPGGVGAAIGETFIGKITKQEMKGLEKYMSRVFGSVTTTGIWTSVQYLGYILCDIFKYEWPSGGNPFEPPNVYPFNLLIAFTAAPLLPYVADYLNSKLKRNSRDGDEIQ